MGEHHDIDPHAGGLAASLGKGEGDLILREADVASLLFKSRQCLQGWRHKGVGPRYTRAGRTVLYLKRDVLEWLESRAAFRTNQYAGHPGPGRGKKSKHK